MEGIVPIDVAPLFAGERAALIALLAGLTTEEWRAPTVCAGWSVRDVAAHLLASDVGLVSSWRDGESNPAFARGLDVSSWDGLIAAIDQQNAEWIQATRRINPALLCELLRFTGARFNALAPTLDRDQRRGPVDWVGPEPAPIWLHLAREYSERWVHQQQIRDAVGRPGLTERRWLGPILAAFVLAVPRALAQSAEGPGTSVRLVITGEAGGTWRFNRIGGRWSAAMDAGDRPSAEVELDADTVWRLFTRGIAPEAVERSAGRRGDPALTGAVLRTVAILA